LELKQQLRLSQQLVMTPQLQQAIRLLRLHPLRAADAQQLAAALVLSDFEPRTLPFVTLDGQLAAAARREGFEVLGL